MPINGDEIETILTVNSREYMRGFVEAERRAQVFVKNVNSGFASIGQGGASFSASFESTFTRIERRGKGAAEKISGSFTRTGRGAEESIAHPIDRAFKRGERAGEQFAESTRRRLKNLADFVPGGKLFARGAGFLSGITEGFGGLKDAIELLPGLNVLGKAVSAVTGKIQDGIKIGFDYQRTLEESRLSFTKFFNSSDKADAFIRKLQELRKEGISLDEAAGASRRFLAARFDEAQIPKYLSAVGDAARMTGAEVDAITRALTQMASKGKVSAEEVNQQLAEQGIPAWRYLADAVAEVDKEFAKLTDERRIAKVQKMAEAGRLSGMGGAQAILRGIQKDFGGFSRQYTEQTATGLEAALYAAVAKQLGTAEGPLFDRYKALIRGTLNAVNSETVSALARGAASGSNTAFNAIDEALKQGGNIGAGLIQGVGKSGFDAAKKFIGDFADGIGSHSPATEFIPLGAYSAQGWKIGFAAEMSKNGGYMGLFQNRGGRTPINPRITEYSDLIEQAARQYGIDPNLLRALIQKESSGDRYAKSSAGAMGLTQLMPGTARRYGVTNAYDPAQNITGGAHYLSDLLRMFGGNERLALAGYNAGEGRGKSRTPEARLTTLIEKNIDGVGDYVRIILATRERLTGSFDELDAAVKDLAASTNWRLRGDKDPDKGGWQFGQLSAGEQLQQLWKNPEFRAFYREWSGASGGGDLGSGTGGFMETVPFPVSGRHDFLSSLRPSSTAAGFQTSPDELLGRAVLSAVNLEMAIRGAGDATGDLNGQIQQTVGVMNDAQKKVEFLGITAKDFGQAFQQSWVSAFTRTDQDFKGLMSGFVLTFADALNQMVQQWAATRIAQGIGNFLGGLFGGGLSFPTSGVTQGGILGSLPLGSTAPGYATGTPSAPAGLAWVGEHGRELINLRGGERIYSNRESEKIAGGRAVTNHYYINMPPTPNRSYAPRRSQRELAETVAGVLKTRT